MRVKTRGLLLTTYKHQDVTDWDMTVDTPSRLDANGCHQVSSHYIANHPGIPKNCI